jgi:predicted PurR-regulated permease PerM
LLAPHVSQQITQLVSSLPDAVERVRELLRQVPLLGGLPGLQDGGLDLRALWTRASAVFTGVFGAFANGVIVLFLSIYLAAQPHLYVEGLVALFPKGRRPRLREVMHRIGDTLGRWLIGKLLTMLIVGVLTASGLVLLDVPLALALGLVAGLFEFIPYLGPILAGVPAVLIAFSQSPILAFYVFLLFVFIQAAESYLLQPIIAHRMVSMPPALTIGMQVLLALPFGLLGVALATPLTATVLVVISMLYVQDVLDDSVTPPGGD